MPGCWSPWEAERLAGAAQPAQLSLTNPMPAHVAELLSFVVLPVVTGIIDPVSSSSTITSELRILGFNPISNDPSDAIEATFHMDYTHPQSFARLQGSHEVSTEAIITRIPPFLGDILLPLFCQYAGSVVCVLLPSTYFTHAPVPRQQWLDNLRKHDRLLLVPSTAGPTTVEHVWFVWFASAWASNALRKPVLAESLCPQILLGTRPAFDSTMDAKAPLHLCRLDW